MAVRQFLMGWAVVGCLGVPAIAQDTKSDSPTEKATVQEQDQPVLDIGSAAPALKTRDWVKGEKVDGFKSGQVYVIEFWATWCGPCKGSMPHLAELQTKYGDKVQLIGVSTEKTDVVTDFLKEDRVEGVTWDKTVTYRLAMDDEGQTNNAYMNAAGEQGIPTAFIIGREGLVEWIGHPMQMDEPLEKIASGAWDRTIAKKERAEAKAQMLAMMKAQRELRQALQAGNLDGAITIVDDLMASQPKAVQLGLVKLQLLGERENKDEARRFADEMVTKAWDNPLMLNELSWGIAAEKTFEGTLDTALRAATRAVELTKEKDGSIMDTLARVYFEQGRLDDAIQWSRKAVALTEHPEVQEALKRYEAAKAEKNAPGSEPEKKP